MTPCHFNKYYRHTMKGAKRICFFLENRIYDTCGGVAEWFKATVLKTVLGNTNVGSNPTATFSLHPSFMNEIFASVI